MDNIPYESFLRNKLNEQCRLLTHYEEKRQKKLLERIKSIWL